MHRNVNTVKIFKQLLFYLNYIKLKKAQITKKKRKFNFTAITLMRLYCRLLAVCGAAWLFACQSCWVLNWPDWLAHTDGWLLLALWPLQRDESCGPSWTGPNRTVSSQVPVRSLCCYCGATIQWAHQWWIRVKLTKSDQIAMINKVVIINRKVLLYILE